MRYPLPYAFARTHQLLLEDDAGNLTLCVHPDSASAPLTPRVNQVPRQWSVRSRATPISPG
jgi:general secretion pathway protein E